MKSLFGVLFLVVLLTAPGCRAQPPVAKITLHVVNQDGQPVSDTEIEAGFFIDDGNMPQFKKWPDKNGYVSFESPVLTDAGFSNTRYASWRNPDVVDKYYTTSIHYNFTNYNESVKTGKWQPWNPTIEMVLKEKKKPIPMYATDRQNEKQIPLRNKWCGFDMEKNDWVAPHGSGNYADIEVFIRWDGKIADQYTGAWLTIRFPDPEAGFYPFQLDAYSSFLSPYHAITNEQYQKELNFPGRSVQRNDVKDKKRFRSDIGYVFRTRTRVNSEGKVICARYGKMYPPHVEMFYLWRGGKSFIFLPYYLNPTENDTNLESDPEKNLFKKFKYGTKP